MLREELHNPPPSTVVTATTATASATFTTVAGKVGGKGEDEKGKKKRRTKTRKEDADKEENGSPSKGVRMRRRGGGILGPEVFEIDSLPPSPEKRPLESNSLADLDSLETPVGSPVEEGGAARFEGTAGARTTHEGPLSPSSGRKQWDKSTRPKGAQIRVMSPLSSNASGSPSTLAEARQDSRSRNAASPGSDDEKLVS